MIIIIYKSMDNAYETMYNAYETMDHALFGGDNSASVTQSSPARASLKRIKPKEKDGFEGNCLT